MKIGFSGLLLLLFIGLKLGGVITWSWLWVLAPAWIPFALIMAIPATLLFITAVAELIQKQR